MRIYRNLAALKSYHSLNRNCARASNSFERPAVRNAQDGISLLRTAEGALAEIQAILQMMRELAVQAANDTSTVDDRIEIQKEVDRLKDEIDRIADATELNTGKLVGGTGQFRPAADQGYGSRRPACYRFIWTKTSGRQ